MHRWTNSVICAYHHIAVYLIVDGVGIARDWSELHALRPRDAAKGDGWVEARAFGEALQQALDRSHLENASQLAAAAGIRRLNVYRWLSGESSSPQQRRHVIALARELGLRRAETNYLLHLAEFLPVRSHARGAEDESIPADERALIASWRDGPSNLSSDVTSFVGRASELYALAELVCRPAVRLITLSGPGGSGKTRLAQRVARELLDLFSDGVWYVPLSAAGSVQDALTAMRRTLGLREAANVPDLERIAQYLEARNALLVLDNVEQIAALGPTLVDLLRRTEHLKLLATSRVALHVSGEHEHNVAPFELPSDEEGWESGRTSDALQLFVERATARKRTFRLSAENYPDVLEICRRLSGAPLSLELAAARVPMFSPAELLRAFPSLLDLAADGPLDVDERQRSLRATIDWSLALASQEAGSVCDIASVFAGGWTLDALAMTAATVDPDLDVRTALDELVDGNLIQFDASAGRYSMHLTVQERALERLQDSGEEFAAREAHARYCLSLVDGEQRFVPLTQPEAWLEALDRERANCMAALAHALERDDAVIAAGLCSMLWPYWHEYSQMVDGRRWIEQVHAVIDGDERVPERLSAWLRTGLLAMLTSHGEYSQALELSADLRQAWEHRGSSYGCGLVGHFESWVTFATGDPARAIEQARNSTGHWQQAGLPHGVAASLNHLAFMLIFSGEFDAALQILDQARELHRRLDDRVGSLRTDHDTGTALLFKGDVEGGIRMLERVVLRRDDAAQSYIVPATLFYLGYAYCLAGQLERALECERESLPLRLDLGDRLGVSYNLLAFAAIASRLKDWERAARLCGAAEAIHAESGIAFNPVSQHVYASESGAVRKALGDAAYAAAFEQGASLPLRDIVAEAMELQVRPEHERP